MTFNTENYKMLRKTVLFGAALLMLFAVGSASADVEVDVTYTKNKFVFVDETIAINKTVTLEVDVFVDADFGAEAEALVNQVNRDNDACQACTNRSDTMDNSTNNNDGVVVVNTAAGDLNNQASAIAISVDLSPSEPPTTSEKDGLAFANTQAATEQINGGSPDAGSTIDSADSPGKTASLTNSINTNTGVVHYNDATGVHANQANTLALSVGFGTGGVALSEADLGQLSSYMTANESAAADGEVPLDEGGVTKSALLSNSVVGNTGIVNGNQSVGNGSNQANIVAFAFIVGQQAGPVTPADN